MLPRLAHLTTDARASDNRSAVRRSLRLEVRASSPKDATTALVRNLSERGLLIETGAELAIGESIRLDLPEAGACEARIIWRDGSFFGCEFITPVSKAAISAALLVAPIERGPATELPRLPEKCVFSDDLKRPESEFQAYPAPFDIILMGSLVIALFMVVLFIYSLLTFPFST